MADDGSLVQRSQEGPRHRLRAIHKSPLSGSVQPHTQTPADNARVSGTLLLRRSAAVNLLDTGTFGAVFKVIAVVVRKVSNHVETFAKARLNLELVFLFSHQSCLEMLRRKNSPVLRGRAQATGNPGSVTETRSEPRRTATFLRLKR